MFSSGIALDLQIKNIRTQIANILQNLIPGIISGLSGKYNKTGGLISGDVEISGNVALTNTEISGVSQQTFQEDIVLLGAKIMMGPSASSITQGVGGIAIGTGAGTGFQGANSVAIGTNSGQDFQGSNSVAIGIQSGRSNQGGNAVAIGSLSGQTQQGINATAVGNFAGRNTQGLNATAVGSFAGFFNQGENAVAIGSRAGRLNQATRSIILNATGVDLTSSVEDTFIVAPVREITGNKILQYDTTNKEISFSNTIDISDNLVIKTPQVNIETENLTLTGAGLQSASAGANSGQYLRINLNGTFYKIILYNDVPAQPP